MAKYTKLPSSTYSLPRNPCTDNVAIMVARHIYKRFHLLMQEKCLDANSLMQYLFYLYTSYGKDSSAAKPPVVKESTGSKTTKKSSKFSKNNQLIKKSKKVSKKKGKIEGEATESNPANENESLSRCDDEKRANYPLPDNKSHNLGNNVKTFSKMFKVSLNTNTGSFKVWEVTDENKVEPASCGKQVSDLRLLFEKALPNICPAAEKIQNQSHLSSSINAIGNTNLSLHNSRTFDDRVNSNANSSVYYVDGSSLSNEKMAKKDLSIVTGCNALQRSRRKSKPQKIVSLPDDNSGAEITANSISDDRLCVGSAHSTDSQLILPFNNGDSKYTLDKYEIKMPLIDKCVQRSKVKCKKLPNRFNCPSSIKAFNSPSQLPNHQTQVCKVNENNFSCLSCKLSFGDGDKLKTHDCNNKTRKAFKCLKCYYTCRQRRELEEHSRTHDKSKNLACHLCAFKTAWRKSLREHIFRHSNTKPYKCSVCSFACNDRNNLRQHQATHSESRCEVCGVCGARFKHRRLLTIHKRIHSNIKTYKCTQCNYASVSASNLIAHKVTHTKSKKHSCNLCGSSFRHPILLNKHINLKHSHKYQKCSVCNYSSNSINGLRGHMRIHRKQDDSIKCTDKLSETSSLGKTISETVSSGLISYISKSLSPSRTSNRALSNMSDGGNNSNYLNNVDIEPSISHDNDNGENDNLDVSVDMCDLNVTGVDTEVSSSNDHNVNDLNKYTSPSQSSKQSPPVHVPEQELPSGEISNNVTNYLSRESFSSVFQEMDRVIDPSLFLTSNENRADFEMILSHPFASQADRLSAMINLLREYSNY